MNEKIENRLNDLGLWYDLQEDGDNEKLVIYPTCNYRRSVAYFECPFCIKKYKNNGQPYKYSKPVTHIHGTYGGEYGERASHCCVQARELYGLKCFAFHILPPNFTLSFK